MVRFRSHRALVLALLVCGGLVATACSPTPTSTPVGADCTAAPVVVAGAQLAGCNLGALNLAGIDLTGIDLHGANLAGSNLSGANLTGANLSMANLTGANLTDANLTNAVLSGALLFGALLVGALLNQTVFWDGWVEAYRDAGGGHAAPSDGVPSGSQAWNDRGEPWCGQGFKPQPAARSVRTDSSTSFAGAHFTLNEIRGLDFRVGDFTGATFDFRGGPWTGCVSFAGGRFHGATFVSWQTDHVDRTGADFSGTTWINVGICQDTFDAANLTDARFLPQSQVQSCADYSADGWPLNPPYTVSFKGANLTRTQFDGSSTDGNAWGPYGPSMNWFNKEVWDPDLGMGVSAGAPDFRGANLTGATATATQFGPADYAGATCPNGSTGSAANPCFPEST